MKYSKLETSNPVSASWKPSYWQGLRWRLMSGLGVVLLGTLLLIGVSVAYFVFQTEQQAWQGRQEEAARNAAKTVQVFIQNEEDILHFVGLLSRGYLSTSPRAMNDILERNPALLEIVRADSRGRISSAVHQDSAILANLFTISQSQWFLEAIAGHTYLSSVHISANHEPYLIIAVPASDGGVVAARLRMTVLWDVVADIHFGATGRAYVITREGRIIAHTNPQVALANTSIADRPEFKAIEQNPNLTWSDSYVNFEGTPVVGTISPVPDTPWLIVTELARSEAFTVTKTALVLLGGGVLIFGLLVGLISVPLLERLILKPMEQLRDGAEKIGQGDLSYQIDIARQDEVGQVALAFNNMTHQLQERERELVVARDHALQASRLKTELLARVSHELRTPLGAILGFTEMLQIEVFGPTNEEQRQIMTQVIQSTQYLTTLINELLDQAKLEAGQLKLNIIPFNPVDLVKDVQAKMNVLAQVKSLTLNTKISGNIPTILSGDPIRLQQILVNLISNSIKFTDRGSIQINLSMPDNHHWAIQVSDTGLGIPLTAQTLIFEPFRQADGSITRSYGGTGLGLSIVKQLVTLMGGQITLESRVGQGSTFMVTLPLEQALNQQLKEQMTV